MNGLSFPASAYWIGSAHPFDLSEAYLCFRRTLKIESQPGSAGLFITADSRYKLWVNGEYFARGPARCYAHAQSVDRLDLTSYLKRGLNCLAVQVYQPGYSHFAYEHRGAAGLLAHLTCDGQSVLATDASWRTRRDPSFRSIVPRVSIYGSGIEARYLSLDEQWQISSYDDSAWSAARVVAPIGGYPWTALEPRAVPLLTEREIGMTLLETRVGPYPGALDPDAHLALRRGWFDARTHVIQADGTGWFSVQLETGQAAYWLFDLGRDHICQGPVEVRGALGQEALAVSYAEKIRKGELILSDPQDYCRMRMTDRFHLRQGEQVCESFSLRGGRYLLFQLCGPSDTAFGIRFRARAVECPQQIKRELHSTDPILEKVIKLCEETLRACLLDGFVDSTWRESSQWVGDALPQALTLSAMSEDIRPLRRVIEMAAQGAYPDGVLPSVLPSQAHAYTVLDYNLTWVELLSLLWHLPAPSIEFVDAMWPVLVKMLDRFHQDMDADGLITSQPGRRLFLDWAPVSRNEPSAIYNLHYLLALQLAEQLAGELGVARRAAHLAREPGIERQATLWQERAKDLQAAIRAAFWHDERWYDDQERTTFSQLAASLALLTHTANPTEENGLLQAIAARSLDPDDSFDPSKMVLASPFMHHYVFEALRRGGKTRDVVEIIRRRWGRWVKAGYPTAWENWNVDFPDGSQCHAFSAHPRYHLAEIARTVGHL